MTNRQESAPRCDCGSPIEACAGCQSPRCTACEPYVSDDCTVVARAG